jgi:hypothetical protein
MGFCKMTTLPSHSSSQATQARFSKSLLQKKTNTVLSINYVYFFDLTSKHQLSFINVLELHYLFNAFTLIGMSKSLLSLNKEDFPFYHKLIFVSESRV